MGDAAGRDDDPVGSSDRDFAEAIGLPFKTPEEAFGWVPAPSRAESPISTSFCRLDPVGSMRGHRPRLHVHACCVGTQLQDSKRVALRGAACDCAQAIVTSTFRLHNAQASQQRRRAYGGGAQCRPRQHLLGTGRLQQRYARMLLSRECGGKCLFPFLFIVVSSSFTHGVVGWCTWSRLPILGNVTATQTMCSRHAPSKQQRRPWRTARRRSRRRTRRRSSS